MPLPRLEIVNVAEFSEQMQALERAVKWERDRWRSVATAFAIERVRRQQLEHSLGFQGPHKTAAAVLPIHHSGRAVWLALRTKHAPLFPGVWECPVGKAEIGESPPEAIIREADEEAGLQLTLGRLEPAGMIRVCRTAIHGVPDLDVAVFLYTVWLALGEEPTNTEPNHRGPWVLVPLEAVSKLAEPLAPSAAALVAVAATQVGVVR